MSLLKRLLTIGFGLGVLAALALATLMLVNDWSFKDLKRETRIALGLPKFWVNDFYEDAASSQQVQCPSGNPLVIVSGGQSNAANSYGEVEPFDSDQRTAMFFNGNCYALSSPVLGASGTGESLWPQLGQSIATEFGRPVVFISGAVGGSQVSDWLDDRSGYRARLVESITKARGQGLEPDLVLWIQGETDAGIRVNPGGFAADMASLITAIEKEAGMNLGHTDWLLYRSTHCLDRPNNGPELEAALAELAADPADSIYLGPSLTAFSDDLRRDNCHLNRAGRDRLVQETLATLAKLGILAPD